MPTSFGVPFDWLDDFKYFFTYHGDIYSGFLTSCPGYKDGFFAIQKGNHQRYRNLNQGEMNANKLRELGREIRDKDVIKVVAPLSGSIGEVSSHESHWRDMSQLWNKMFIFGAGASSNCVFGDESTEYRKSPLQSPLGYDIFDKKYEPIFRNYPGAKLSISNFRANKNDIELCLENEWEMIKHYYSPSITTRHINIQYFLSDLFKQVSANVIDNFYAANLYNLFCQKIYNYIGKNERIAMVSFNYDTILDQFIEQNFGIKYSKPFDYIDWDKHQILLFKPHGSCNWGWKFKESDYAGNHQTNIALDLYQNKTEPYQIYYSLLGDINEMVLYYSYGIEASVDLHDRGRHTINKNRIQVFESHQSGYFPALLMPHKDKDEFVMPYTHHNAINTFTDRVEELYLIGWKGNEVVFNNLLKEKARSLKKIVIVNKDEKCAEEVKKNISPYLKTNKDIFEYGGTFEEFVLTKMDTIFKRKIEYDE